jgi:cardiolipin synthase
VIRTYLLPALPNLISMGRLLAVPVAVWLILSDRLAAAFWLFVAAGISDAVDGYVARRFGLRTLIGSYLDPLADKALLVSLYVTLGVQGHIAPWLIILVVSRDVLIVGGAVLYRMLAGKLTMQPLFISKINTVAQIALVGVLLAELGLGLVYRPLTNLLTDIVGATTLLSGAAYLSIWGWRIARMEDGA